MRADGNFIIRFHIAILSPIVRTGVCERRILMSALAVLLSHLPSHTGECGIERAEARTRAQPKNAQARTAAAAVADAVQDIGQVAQSPSARGLDYTVGSEGIVKCRMCCLGGSIGS